MTETMTETMIEATEVEIDLRAGAAPAAADAVAQAGVRKVVLAEPRGFCAGVEMAIKSLAWMVELFEPPVYCYHDIVHNISVVDEFRKAGVIFVNDISEVPEGAPVMLSAHGSAPEVVEEANKRAAVMVNAACPLVTKVHHEVKKRAGQGYDVIYVGHSGHDEAIGTMAVAPEAVHLVEKPEDVAALQDERPVAFLAQTTLSMDEWAEVRDEVQKRFTDVWMPGRSDLCFATTNRQTALKELVQQVDAVIVIGSKSSSNTNALERVARESGGVRVIRIETAADLPDDLDGIVGVTAGASVPARLVEEVVAVLQPVDGTETLRTTEEEEYFPLPRGLRERLTPEALAADRRTPASAALERLRTK